MSIDVTGHLGTLVKLKDTQEGDLHIAHHRVDGDVSLARSPATPTEVMSGAGSVQAIAPTAGLVLMGYGIRESSAGGDVAITNLRRGEAANAPLLFPSTLGALQSDKAWFGPDGIACAEGIFIERVSGTTHIVLYTKEQ